MRHAGGAPNEAALEASREAAKAAAKKPARKSVRGISDEAFLRRLDELKALLSGASKAPWEGVHFVALYADLHFRVYAVVDSSLGPKERVYAAKLASDMLAKDFAGDPAAMARYVSWTWTREKGREEWRRSNGKPGGTVTWRAQFGRSLLTQFRVEEAREKAKKR